MFDFLNFFKPKYKKYGWTADIPDARDYVFEVAAAPVLLPKSVDLRKDCPPVWNQGELGSCSSHATAAACEIENIQAKKPTIMPARLFIYYNTRVLEGTVSYDSGATIRNAVKAVVTNGYCDEKLVPYKIASFKAKPSTAAYTAAAPHKVLEKQYQRVPQTLDVLRSVLAQGNSIIFGFTVYESFESEAVAKTGIMPMPKPTEKALGGHAVVIVGYSDDSKQFIVRNSWGEGWGQKGYFTMPYEFALNSNYCDDFWTISSVN